MQKKSDFVLRLCLIIGDAVALIVSFAAAYYIRVTIDPRPYFFETQWWDFVRTVILLVPIMLAIIAALGLYRKAIVINKSRMPERGRLFIAAILSVAALVVYGYYMDEIIFPKTQMTTPSLAPSSSSLERLLYG